MLRRLTTITRCYSTSSLPSSSEIVIIGGGVIGLSTAYHLSKLGVTNFIVLEKNQITSGTTWHSNGLVWRLRPSDIDIELLTRTQHLISDELLQHEGVESTGWINNGGLFLAHNQERIREYQRIHGMAKYYGIPSFMLGKNDIIKMLDPMIKKDTDVIGGLLSPGDGYVDPTVYCNALIKAGKFKVYDDCQVVEINTKQIDGLGSINSQRKKINNIKIMHKGKEIQEIKTDIIVNSTGVWAPELARLAGIKSIPQETFEHGYLVTQPIDSVDPLKTPNVRDHDLSIALRVSGKSFQISYYEQNPVRITGTENSLAPFSQFDFNWDRAAENIDNSTKLMQVIKDVGIKTTICGPESFTPDHKPLLGEDVNIKGFYYASGFNSFGICMSGGCGQQIAKWIHHGKPDLDMFAYDIRRFNRNLIGNKIWNQQRCHESYAKNYGIVYPQDEHVCARDHCFKDPLYETLLNQGCVYQERHGKLKPGWFDQEFNSTKNRLSIEDYLSLNNSFQFNSNNRMWKSIRNEYEACKKSSAIFNLTSFGKFMIQSQSNSQAKTLVQWLVPDDIDHLPNGQSLKSFMLNSNGKPMADVTVSKINDNSFFIITNDISETAVWDHILNQIQQLQIGQYILVDNVTEKYAILSLHGPKSKSILEKLFQLNLNHHGIYHVNETTRIVNSFNKSWEIHLTIDNLKQVYQQLINQGVTNAGWKTYEMLLMENGILNWGLEVRSNDDIAFNNHKNLLKLNISPSKLKNQAFLGAKQLTNSDNIFCLLKLQSDDALSQGQEPIFYNGEVIGMTRTGTFSYGFNAPIAIGLVKLNQINQSNQVDIEINSKLYTADIQTH